MMSLCSRCDEDVKEGGKDYCAMGRDLDLAVPLCCVALVGTTLPRINDGWGFWVFALRVG